MSNEWICFYFCIFNGFQRAVGQKIAKIGHDSDRGCAHERHGAACCRSHDAAKEPSLADVPEEVQRRRMLIPFTPTRNITLVLEILRDDLAATKPSPEAETLPGLNISHSLQELYQAAQLNAAGMGRNVSLEEAASEATNSSAVKEEAASDSMNGSAVKEEAASDSMNGSAVRVEAASDSMNGSAVKEKAVDRPQEGAPRYSRSVDKAPCTKHSGRKGGRSCSCPCGKKQCEGFRLRGSLGLAKNVSCVEDARSSTSAASWANLSNSDVEMVDFLRGRGKRQAYKYPTYQTSRAREVLWSILTRDKWINGLWVNVCGGSRDLVSERHPYLMALAHVVRNFKAVYLDNNISDVIDPVRFMDTGPILPGSDEQEVSLVREHIQLVQGEMIKRYRKLHPEAAEVEEAMRQIKDGVRAPQKVLTPEQDQQMTFVQTRLQKGSPPPCQVSLVDITTLTLPVTNNGVFLVTYYGPSLANASVWYYFPYDLLDDILSTHNLKVIVVIPEGPAYRVFSEKDAAFRSFFQISSDRRRIFILKEPAKEFPLDFAIKEEVRDWYADDSVYMPGYKDPNEGIFDSTTPETTANSEAILGLSVVALAWGVLCTE